MSDKLVILPDLSVWLKIPNFISQAIILIHIFNKFQVESRFLVGNINLPLFK